LFKLAKFLNASSLPIFKLKPLLQQHQDKLDAEASAAVARMMHTRADDESCLPAEPLQHDLKSILALLAHFDRYFRQP